MKLRQQTLWKVVIFITLAFPAVFLGLNWLELAQTGRSDVLGANPIKETVLSTGEFAIRALLLALCVSPLASLIRRPKINSVRRMLGLFAFFYASVHGLSYVGMEQGFDVSRLVEDILKRWPITLGFVAWLALLPLAITSTSRMVKRLGPKTWQKLHRLVYGLAVVAVVHNILITKGWQVEPLVHLGILAALLAYRMAGRPRLPRLRTQAA